MSVSASASAADPTPHTHRSANGQEHQPGDVQLRRQRRDEQERGETAGEEGGLHDPRLLAAGEPAHAQGQRALLRVEHLGEDDEDRPRHDEGYDCCCGEHGHDASLQDPGGRRQARGVPIRRRIWTAGLRPPIIPTMDVRAQWYDVLASRISRRRFDGRAVPPELREQLEVFCDGASAPAGAPDSVSVHPGAVTAPARVCLVDDPGAAAVHRHRRQLRQGRGHAAGRRLRRARPRGRRRPRRRPGRRRLPRRGLHPRGHAPRDRHLLDRRLVRPRRRRRPRGPGPRRAGRRGHAAGLSHRCSRPAASVCCAPWSRRRRA